MQRFSAYLQRPRVRAPDRRGGALVPRALALLWVVTSFGCVRDGTDDDRVDDTPKGSTGFASLEVVDPEGSPVPASPFHATKVSVVVGRRCDGFDVPYLSEEKCWSELYLSAIESEKRSVTLLRRLSEAPPSGPITLRAGKFAATDKAINVDFNDKDTPAGSLPWASTFPATRSGDVTIEVAADGRVTLRFDRLAMSDLGRKRSFKLSGSIVLECQPAGADAAACKLDGT